MAWRTAGSALAAVSLAVAAAAEEPARFPLGGADLEPREEWYGAYVRGRKIGHALFRVSREGDRVAHETALSLRALADGAERTATFRKRLEFSVSPPHALLAARL
ncbi:MAG: hypothetical protein ACREID_01615, partial [Planctomycetota bacterium]